MRWEKTVVRVDDFPCVFQSTFWLRVRSGGVLLEPLRAHCLQVRAKTNHAPICVPSIFYIYGSISPVLDLVIVVHHANWPHKANRSIITNLYFHIAVK